MLLDRQNCCKQSIYEQPRLWTINFSTASFLYRTVWLSALPIIISTIFLHEIPLSQRLYIFLFCFRFQHWTYLSIAFSPMLLHIWTLFAPNYACIIFTMTTISSIRPSVWDLLLETYAQQYAVIFYSWFCAKVQCGGAFSLNYLN